MRKLLLVIKDNLWVIILDIIAVNAAYYLAFVIRFWLNGEIQETAARFLPTYYSFIPYYTIICLIVFSACKLYNGMWRYAGLGDMNRILVANLVTAVFHAGVTILFFTRMPLTYYIVGACIQFFFIAFIRFAYRIMLVEKKKIRSWNEANIKAVIIGANDLGRKASLTIHETKSYKIVGFFDSSEKLYEKMIDGIPVFMLDDLPNKLKDLDIKSVFIADPMLSDHQRDDIRDVCADVELIDMTGFLSNQVGLLSLSSLMKKISGPVEIIADGKKTSYINAMDALAHLNDRYEVDEVSSENGTTIIKLDKTTSSGSFVSMDEWAKAYQQETGEEISFF